MAATKAPTNRIKAELDGAPKTRTVTIKAPNMRVISIPIVGVEPLGVHRFSEKAKKTMMDAQEAGSTARSKRNREPKDFEALYHGSYYKCGNWFGIPASAFRAAAISACRIVGFKMTHAKLSIFCLADGRDDTDGTPLVKITSGKPEMWVAPCRNDNGSADIRVRSRWMEWGATIRLRYDADQFTEADVVNLMDRVGQQVGIGEGRPDSKESAGLGMGLFTLGEGVRS